LTGKLLRLLAPASVAIAYVSIALAVSVSPWFTWTGNWLSDLGAHPRSAPIFNTGLIVSGMLASVFSIHLTRSLKGAGRAGGVLLTAGSASLTLVGCLPETAGRPHLYVSAAFFTLSSLALIVLGAHAAAVGKRLQGALTSTAGAVSAASMLLPRPWPGGAIPEMIAATMFSTVLVYLSAWELPDAQPD